MLPTKINTAGAPEILRAFCADYNLTQLGLQAELGLSATSPIVGQWIGKRRNPKPFLWLALLGLTVRLKAEGRLQGEATWLEVAQKWAA